MNDLSSYYPSVPSSLISNPLHARGEDFLVARRIISLIAVSHREKLGLTEQKMAVIPTGIRYHSIALESNGSIGDLQITENIEQDSYSIIGYFHEGNKRIPHVMRMGVEPLEINDILHSLIPA